MKYEITVSKDDWVQASEIVEEIQTKYPDAKPSSFSRDFESAMVIAAATLLIAMICYFNERPGEWIWLRVLGSGAIGCVFVEAMHRRLRWKLNQYSLVELMLTVFLAAACLAIWRIGA